MPFKYTNMQERIIANSIYCPQRYGECWLWIGRLNNNGYGVLSKRFKRGPRKGKVHTVLAHRESLRVFTGRLLSTKSKALHSCDVRACCNPAHLTGGSQKKNVNDCVKRGRHRNAYKKAA